MEFEPETYSGLLAAAPPLPPNTAVEGRSVRLVELNNTEGLTTKLATLGLEAYEALAPAAQAADVVVRATCAGEAASEGEHGGEQQQQQQEQQQWPPADHSPQLRLSRASRELPAGYSLSNFEWPSSRKALLPRSAPAVAKHSVPPHRAVLQLNGQAVARISVNKYGWAQQHAVSPPVPCTVSHVVGNNGKVETILTVSAAAWERLRLVPHASVLRLEGVAWGSSGSAGGGGRSPKRRRLGGTGGSGGSSSSASAEPTNFKVGSIGDAGGGGKTITIVAGAKRVPGWDQASNPGAAAQATITSTWTAAPIGAALYHVRMERLARGAAGAADANADAAAAAAAAGVGGSGVGGGDGVGGGGGDAAGAAHVWGGIAAPRIAQPGAASLHQLLQQQQVHEQRISALEAQLHRLAILLPGQQPQLLPPLVPPMPLPPQQLLLTPEATAAGAALSATMPLQQAQTAAALAAAEGGAPAAAVAQAGGGGGSAHADADAVPVNIEALVNAFLESEDEEED